MQLSNKNIWRQISFIKETYIISEFDLTNGEIYTV